MAVRRSQSGTAPQADCYTQLASGAWQYSWSQLAARPWQCSWPELAARPWQYPGSQGAQFPRWTRSRTGRLSAPWKTWPNRGSATLAVIFFQSNRSLDELDWFFSWPGFRQGTIIPP